MKASVAWLQTYFDEPLPEAAELEHVLTFGVAEIEGVEQAGEDTIIDVKVLPDRAPYMLSHRGIAKELAVLLDRPLKDDPLVHDVPEFDAASEAISVHVDDAKRCPAYAAARIRGVRVGPSPAWLRERLERIGQRSINNIVDATNYVMFDLGTPLHAFDAAKLSAVDGAVGILVRNAHEGEKITALGGEEYALTTEMTVIADRHSDAPLAIGGIKGGTHAEVTDATTDIVLEAAKFDPTRTRKTVQALNLRTDASKRFENEIADRLPRYGLAAVIALIQEIAGGEVAGSAQTERVQPAPFMLGVSAREANRRLGIALDDAALAALLSRLGLPHERIGKPLSRVLELAQTLVGAAYKADSAMRFDAPAAFSCSSLTNYLFVHGAGVALPSISIDQYAATTPIEAAELQPGDMVFANSGTGRVRTETVQFVPGTEVPEGIDHVALLVGENEIIHASSSRGKVLREELETSPMFRNIVGYRRVLSSNEPRFVVTVPMERLDLRQPADLIEELGRVYGYANITEQQLPEAAAAPFINPRFAYAEAVRTAFDALGFTEVYTYALRDEGEVALANALSSDKSHLRKNLTDALSEKLALNESNLPLLGLDAIRLYEIGNVFTNDAEEQHVAVAVRFPAGKKRAAQEKEALESASAAIAAALGTAAREPVSADAETAEWNLSAIIPELPVPGAYTFGPLVVPRTMYRPISSYPFILRDIAAWTPEGTSAEQFSGMIRDEAGELLVRLDLFDQFTKDGRTSYAFHLIFQSAERTLTDEEIAPIMGRIYAACANAGFETR